MKKNCHTNIEIGPGNVKEKNSALTVIGASIILLLLWLTRHCLNKSYTTNKALESENKTDILFCFFFFFYVCGTSSFGTASLIRVPPAIVPDRFHK